MTAGFWVLNDDNFIQIVDTDRNFCLLSKGTVTTTYNPYDYAPSEPLSAADIPTPPGMTGEAFIAFRCRTHYASEIGKFTIGTPGPVGTVIDYWIFDVPPPLPASGEGLAVFRDDGSLAFYSGNKHLRVIDAITGGIANIDRTYPTGKQYAVIQGGAPYITAWAIDQYHPGWPGGPLCPPGGVWGPTGEPCEYSTMNNQMSVAGCRFVEDNRINIQTWTIFNTQTDEMGDLRGNSIFNDSRQITWMVIDVTNY